ncbi:amidohydrolase [Leptolyngbya sp. AN02str]|uniref:amidohydrolase n=1 Tax=Leptolyngbya sp. AN02str TaxID=3423363 RepID=UPI003D323F92
MTTIQKVWIPTESGYQSVDVRIEGDKIAAIAPELEPSGHVVDGKDKLLLPGFVNAHTHSPELWQRGSIGPLPLELWLGDLHDFAPLDPEAVYLSAVGTAVETLLSGGTTVVDHLVLSPGQEAESVEAAVRGYRDAGIRAFVGPLIQDMDLQAGLPSGGLVREVQPFPLSTQATLELMADLVERFHRPEDGIYIMVAPTGMQLCTDELFAGCIELSDCHQLRRHTHMLETKAQKMLAYEKYGCSAVQHLKEIGFLNAHTSLAHCVWLDDADIAMLAETRSTVVHNPLSNLRLGSGIAPVLKYRAAGVNVTFGCDGSASNDAQDVLEAIKIGSTLHNTTTFEYRQWITPRQAIEMASLGGATGLGMAEELGTLTVGKKADLVMYDLTSLSLLPKTDPIGLLVLGRPTNVVDYAWVNGKSVVAEGKVATVDVEQLRETLWERSQWISDRPTPTRTASESHYRKVMGLQP